MFTLKNACRIVSRWPGGLGDDRLGLCRQESLRPSQNVCSLPLYIHRASFPPFGAFPFWAYWQHLGPAVTAHLALCHCACVIPCIVQVHSDSLQQPSPRDADAAISSLWQALRARASERPFVFQCGRVMA